MILVHPFLTEIYNKKTDENIVCLIQSISKNYISFYDISLLKSMDKERFIRLADNWWKHQPTLPISIFYQGIFDQFDYAKKCLESNTYLILKGFHGIKLKNLSEKRIKRKVIHID